MPATHPVETGCYGEDADTMIPVGHRRLRLLVVAVADCKSAIRQIENLRYEGMETNCKSGRFRGG